MHTRTSKQSLRLMSIGMATLASVLACGGASRQEPEHAGQTSTAAEPSASETGLPADSTKEPGAAPVEAADAHDHGHGDHGAPSSEAPATDLLAAERAAYEGAQPIFERYCSKCHSSSSPRATRKALDHFDMSRYPFAGHHAGEAGTTVRAVLGASGKRATMPRDKPGAVEGDELALVLSWADAFTRAHNAGLHRGSGHDHDAAQGGHSHEH